MSKEFPGIEDLHAWYGESHILHGVNLTVNEGEVVTLLPQRRGPHHHRCAPSSA